MDEAIRDEKKQKTIEKKSLFNFDEKKEDIIKNKTLFDFNEENSGLRSISFFDSNRKIEYASSKWEVTPRTATQTNRLKWDQTPLGIIKIETENFLLNKVRTSETGWDMVSKEDEGFMLSKDLRLNDINVLLPKEGYEIHNFKTIDNQELVEISYHNDFDEKEKEFFMPLFQSKDKEEKFIYQCLLTLLKGDKKQKKNVIKRLTKAKNIKLMTEKVILFSMYFEHNPKDKERILKIFERILMKPKIFFQKEIVYVLTTFVFDASLKHQAFEALKHIFKRGLENIVNILKEDLSTNDRQLMKHIGKVMSISMLYFGYDSFKPFLNSIVRKKEYGSTLMVLKAHMSFFKLKEDDDFIELYQFYEIFEPLLQNKRYLVEMSNIISSVAVKYKGKNFSVLQLYFFRFLYEILFNELCVYNYQNASDSGTRERLTFLKDNIKNSVDECKNLLSQKNYIEDLSIDINRGLSILNLLESCPDYEWKLFDDTKSLFWVIPVLRSLGFLSRNDEICSKILFYFLNRLPSVNINNLKIFDKICCNLENPQWYLISIFERILVPENVKHRKVIISAFLKNLPNKSIEELLLRKIEEPQISDIVVEIFTKLPEYSFSDEFQDLFSESLFVLIKNRNSVVIENLDILVEKSNFDPLFLSRIYELAIKYLEFKDKIDRENGVKILIKITRFLDKKKLFYLGNVIWEHLSKEDDVILSLNIQLLEQIYVRYRFKSIEEIVSACLPFLRIKSFLVAESLFYFLTTTLSENLEKTINPKELMRIIYEAVEYMKNWRSKNVYALLEAVSNFISVHDILNILLGYLALEINDNTKKGIVIAISKLSKFSGFYKILPVLLIEYSYHNYNIKIRILRSIILSMREISSEGSPYIYSLIPLVEDCMYDEDRVYRTLGLKLVRSIINCYDKKSVDLNVITHLINVIWINVLETNTFIKKEFNLCMESLSDIVDGSFFFYYLIQGLHHPSKKIKNRYKEIYTILNKKADMDIEVFIDKELRK